MAHKRIFFGAGVGLAVLAASAGVAVALTANPGATTAASGAQQAPSVATSTATSPVTSTATSAATTSAAATTTAPAPAPASTAASDGRSKNGVTDEDVRKRVNDVPINPRPYGQNPNAQGWVPEPGTKIGHTLTGDTPVNDNTTPIPNPAASAQPYQPSSQPSAGVEPEGW